MKFSWVSWVIERILPDLSDKELVALIDATSVRLVKVRGKKRI